MIHKMNMEVCDHCGRVVEEDKIDEYGICKSCYEYTEKSEDWMEQEDEL